MYSRGFGRGKRGANSPVVHCFGICFSPPIGAREVAGADREREVELRFPCDPSMPSEMTGTIAHASPRVDVSCCGVGMGTWQARIAPS